MQLFAPYLTTLNKNALMIACVLLMTSCSGGGGSNTDNSVSNDRYVFATDGTAIVDAAKGVLANDGDSITSVAIQLNVASSSTLALAQDGSFTYTPGENITSDSFTYQATGSDGSTKSATVSISIINGVASCTVLNVLQAQSTILATNFSDADNLTFTLKSNPGKGSLTGINSQTGQASYSHNGTVRGTEDIVYTVTDEFGGSVDASYRVVLTPVRIMPLGDSITQGVESNSETEIGDPDLDTPALPIRVGYRKKLFDSLNDAGYSFDFVGTETNAGDSSELAPFDFQHQGHPGYSDAEVAGQVDPDTNTDGFNVTTDGVFNWLNANSADIILLHIGTNNVEFRTSSVFVERILDEIRRWQSSMGYSAPVSVLVAKIIDKRDGNTPIDAVAIYNANIQSLVNSRNTIADDLTLVDMFNGVSISLLDVDQTHLTPSGYETMAQLWNDAMVQSDSLSKCN